MSKYKIAGLFNFKINGEVFYVKGNVSYSPGGVKREAKMASNGQVIGYTETPQAPYMELEITDRSDLDLVKLFNLEGATVSGELCNGKVIVLREAWYAGDSKVETQDANISCKFEGMSFDEVR